MKVRLLNNGGFNGMEGVDFSTIFEATLVSLNLGVDILIKDLIDAGAHANLAVLNEDELDVEDMLYFSAGTTGWLSKEYEEVH